MVGTDHLFIFIKPTMCEGKACLGLAQPYSVRRITICKSWYAEVRVGTIPVIYFYKIYNVWGESKVRVGSSIVLYVTQHFACHHMQGLGLAQTQLYIFIKATICERKIRKGKGGHNHCSVCRTTFSKSSYGGVRVGTDPVIYSHKPTFCEGEQG